MQLQRWVDCPLEFATRRTLRQRTVVISAADGSLRGHRGGGPVEEAAVCLFADPEQERLLASTFRTQPGPPPDAAAAVLALASRAVVVELAVSGDESEGELADGFRALRLWAPHRVLAQLMLELSGWPAGQPPSGSGPPALKRPRGAGSGGGGGGGGSDDGAAAELRLELRADVLELRAGTGGVGLLLAAGRKQLAAARSK